MEYYFTSRSFHAFGLRLLGGGGFIKGEVISNEIVYPPIPDNFRTGLLFLGGGFVYAMKLGSGVPYLSVTIGYMMFDPGDKNGYKLPNNDYSIYKKETVLYSGEAGIRVPFSDIWSLNLGLNINFANTDYLDDIKKGNNNDAFISFFTGVSFYLGKNIDNDNDGVDDDIDLCLDTPEGEGVDEFGCSISSKSLDEYSYDISKDKFVSNGIFTDGNKFCFQVNVLRNLSDAEELYKKITSLDYSAFIINMPTGKTVWYSVRIGYRDSYKNAKLYKENFFKQTKLKLKN